MVILPAVSMRVSMFLVVGTNQEGEYRCQQHEHQPLNHTYHQFHEVKRQRRGPAKRCATQMRHR